MEIKYKIKELKYIRRDKVVTYCIHETVGLNLEEATKLIKSLDNADKITKDTYFDWKYDFVYNDNSYVVLECEYGLFITRTDNVKPKVVFDNILDKFGIKALIHSGDKTILVNNDKNKYMTTKNIVDDNDIEKAVMLLLLKREGYTYEDIAELTRNIDYK